MKDVKCVGYAICAVFLNAQCELIILYASELWNL